MLKNKIDALNLKKNGIGLLVSEELSRQFGPVDGEGLNIKTELGVGTTITFLLENKRLYQAGSDLVEDYQFTLRGSENLSYESSDDGGSVLSYMTQQKS